MTQFQFMGTVEAISERFLLPVLEEVIRQVRPPLIGAVQSASADGYYAAFETASSFMRMSSPMLPAILDADALTEFRARCA